MSKNWSAEYTIKKGDVSLQVYRRCKTPPAKGSKLPVVFLVHGSSFGALAGYDLQVPGYSDYSMMDLCAGHGYDVWTMDHEGYGRSQHTESNSDIASGAADVNRCPPGGAEGVAHVIKVLRQELLLTMAVLGRRTIASIDRSILWE